MMTMVMKTLIITEVIITNMKLEKHDNGWSEITTERVEITMIVKFMTMKTWNQMNIDHPELSKGKLLCKLCKCSFLNSNDKYIYLATTNRGNKLLCEKCAKEFINKGIKLIENTLSNQ